jgi:hypothetical protein
MSYNALPRKSENFDPQFCGMLCKITAIVCVALTVSAFIGLMTLSSKCLGWTAHMRQGGTPHVWGSFIITAPWSFWIAYNALKWPRFAWRVYDQIQSGKQTLMDPQANAWLMWRAMNTQQNINTIFLLVCTFSVFFSAIPLFVMITECS